MVEEQNTGIKKREGQGASVAMDAWLDEFFLK